MFNDPGQIDQKMILNHKALGVLHFFGYMTGFPFQNKPRNLVPSHKIDQDFWDYFGRDHLIAGFHKNQSEFGVILERVNPCFIAK